MYIEKLELNLRAVINSLIVRRGQTADHRMRNRAGLLDLPCE